MAITVKDTVNAGFQTNVASVNVSNSGTLAAGDLAFAFLFLTGTAAGRTWDDLAGWTVIGEITDTTGGDIAMQLMYKVVSSGDVSGGSFTFTISGGNAARAAASVMNISGYNTAQPIEATTTGQTVGSDDTPSFSGLSAPTYANSLYILYAGADEHSAVSSFSGYALATDNPTWTERTDEVYSTVGPGGHAVATAIRSAVTASGNFSFIVDGAAGDTGQSFGFLTIVRPIVSVTVNADVVSLTSSTPAPTEQTGVTFTADVVTATSSVQAPNVVQKREWNTLDKHSASVVNLDKTAL